MGSIHDFWKNNKFLGINRSEIGKFFGRKLYNSAGEREASVWSECVNIVENEGQDEIAGFHWILEAYRRGF